MANGVAIVVAISSILSLLGSAFIVVSYALWPRIRTKSRLWLVWLSVADFVGAAGYGASAFALIFLGDDYSREQKFSCEFQSVVTTWSSAASFCWTVALAVHLYVLIVRGAIESGLKLFPIHFIVCHFIPTVVVVSAVYCHALGYSYSYTTSGWCWISEKPSYPVFGGNSTILRYQHARLFWMLLGGKFWEISSCVIIFVLYFLIRRHMGRQSMQSNDQFPTSKAKMAAGKADRKMIVIPLAFLFLRVWGTTRFFIDVIYKPDHYSSEKPPGYTQLMYFQAIGDTAQGFVNFFIFCMNTETVRHHMQAAICCREEPKYEIMTSPERTPLLGQRGSPHHKDVGPGASSTHSRSNQSTSIDDQHGKSASFEASASVSQSPPGVSNTVIYR